MAAWLWGSSTAPQVKFDELVEQATSSDLPTPTSTFSPPAELLAVSLQLSDLLRSAQVTPQNALAAIRRRLAIPNANVQLLAILLFDVLVKNSGDAFLKETSTNKEFVEQLGDIARNTSNRTVQSCLLRCLQNWATAFETKSSLSRSELVYLYRNLKVQNHPFPLKDESATAAMIDSLAAPEWRDSDLCSRCRDPFSMTNRKHHCRNCGDIFDHKCSSKFVPLPHFGIQDAVRVCDGCATKLAKGNIKIHRRNSTDSYSTVSSVMPKSPHRRTRSVASPSLNQQEEDDLQLAMKLSLESAQHMHRPGYTQNTTTRSSTKSNQENQENETEEDPDLAAAIAASLQDMQIQSNAPAGSHVNINQEPPRPSQIQPAYELPADDVDALLTFIQSNDAVKRHGKSSDTLTPQFERTSVARPKLLRSIDDSGKRTEMLTEMHEKLHDVVKMYDRILERQIAHHASSVYGRPASVAPPNAGALNSNNYYAPLQRNPSLNTRDGMQVLQRRDTIPPSAPPPHVYTPQPPHQPPQAYYTPEHQNMQGYNQYTQYPSAPPQAQAQPQEQSQPPQTSVSNAQPPYPPGSSSVTSPVTTSFPNMPSAPTHDPRQFRQSQTLPSVPEAPLIDF